MRGWVKIRSVVIDTVVCAVCSILYSTRFPGYSGYLAGRRRRVSFRSELAAWKENITAACAVAVTGAVLRILAVLPPHQGEKLFLSIVNLKNRRPRW